MISDPASVSATGAACYHASEAAERALAHLTAIAERVHHGSVEQAGTHARAASRALADLGEALQRYSQDLTEYEVGRAEVLRRCDAANIVWDGAESFVPLPTIGDVPGASVADIADVSAMAEDLHTRRRGGEQVLREAVAFAQSALL